MSNKYAMYRYVIMIHLSDVAFLLLCNYVTLFLSSVVTDLIVSTQMSMCL